MKNGIIKKSLEIKLLSFSDYVLNLLIGIGIILILGLHFILPVFPALFLFDFVFCCGYPLFLRFILRKKWFECIHDKFLKIKYILLPWLVMEILVLLYYHDETILVINAIIEGNV